MSGENKNIDKAIFYWMCVNGLIQVLVGSALILQGAMAVEGGAIFPGFCVLSSSVVWFWLARILESQNGA